MYKESYNPYEEFAIKKDNYKRKQEIDEELKNERELDRQIETQHQQTLKDKLIAEALGNIKDFQANHNQEEENPKVKEKITDQPKSQDKKSESPQSEPKKQRFHQQPKTEKKQYQERPILKEKLIKYQYLHPVAQDKVDRAFRNLLIKYHPDKISGHDPASLQRKIAGENIIKNLADFKSGNIKKFVDEARRLGEKIDIKL